MESYEGTIEGGVVKFNVPISLPERTKVLVTPAEAAPATPRGDSDEVIAKQQAAWRDLFARMKADPELKREGDGFSGADHDKVLYGGPNGPA